MAEVGIGGDPEVTQRIAVGNRRLGFLVKVVLVLLVIAGIVISTATLVTLSQLREQGEDINAQTAQIAEIIRTTDMDRAARVESVKAALVSIEESGAARTDALRDDIIERIDALQAELEAIHRSLDNPTN